MGGYGLYVWGSFGVTALAMVAEPILVRNRRRAQLLRVTRLRRVKRGQK
ncbi:MAG: heme exporter protein CcmD [Gammaproteobacteria bacterium]|nr:heme exporter protein CcmD [Gammaproteobacteria bacterium]